MRLLLDVGNTRTSIGLFPGPTEGPDRVREHWRVSTMHWTADELLLLVHALLRDKGYAEPTMVGFACVVPQVRHCLREAALRLTGVPPVEVTPGNAGILISYPAPDELGQDRIANAAGALRMGPPPAIVVDFGTATTFDVLDPDGRYVGGTISPGVGTAARELFRKAERLNPVDLDFPASVLAESTADAVRAGVLHAAVGATDHIIDALRAELGYSPALYATGGWAPGIAPRCRNDMRVVADLTLIGVDAVCSRNVQPGTREDDR